MLHIEIAAEKLVEVFGFPITNALLTSWLVMVVLGVAVFFLFRKINIIPSGIQNIFEIVTEAFLDLMEGMFGGRKNAERYFPLIATIFFFVVISNWLGIFPGVGSIGFYEVHNGEKVFVPLLRSAASDLNFTLALGVIAVLFVNAIGIKVLGLGKHLSKYFSFKNPIDFFVGILEFISEFAKMISFSFRLFGNVFAGEVLLAITGFLAPYLIPVPFLGLEVFVGFIQALVFSMLTMVFISIAVSHH